MQPSNVSQSRLSNVQNSLTDHEAGPSHIQIPIIMQEAASSQGESDSIPFADSPDSPPAAEIRKASIAAHHQLHDGIILLITSDSESQKSPSGSITPHPLSEYYLLPLPMEALGANRRYSLQDPTERNQNYQAERKASCPDAELRLSPESLNRRSGSSCSNRRSDMDISKDRLTPTSFASRRSSNASCCHSRRSSNCSLGGHGHHHARRSSNCSRRSSTASSRRSSNCSRRSSHIDSDEESFLHQSHHHHRHRESRSGLDPVHRGSFDCRRSSSIPHPYKAKEELDEREELEMGGIPARHRKIIIMIIGSVSVFILLMSVVLIAVSLTMSPKIDDLVRKGNEEIYRSMSAGDPTSFPLTERDVVSNNTTPSSGAPG